MYGVKAIVVVAAAAAVEGQFGRFPQEQRGGFGGFQEPRMMPYQRGFEPRRFPYQLPNPYVFPRPGGNANGNGECDRKLSSITEELLKLDAEDEGVGAELAKLQERIKNERAQGQRPPFGRPPFGRPSFGRPSPYDRFPYDRRFPSQYNRFQPLTAQTMRNVAQEFVNLDEAQPDEAVIGRLQEAVQGRTNPNARVGLPLVMHMIATMGPKFEELPRIQSLIQSYGIKPTVAAGGD